MDKNEKSAQDKQLSLLRLQTILMACILIILVVVGIFLIGQFSQISKTIAQIDTKEINDETWNQQKIVDICVVPGFPV